MFWIERLSHRDKYCICEQVWKSFKIINVKIDSGYLEVYMTPEDGSRGLVLSLRNGEDCKPENFDTTFTFQIWQHVKIEVFGNGEITIMGKVLPGLTRCKTKGRYPKGCPFNDIDGGDDVEWVQKYGINEFEKGEEERIKEVLRRNGSHHDYYGDDIIRIQREFDRLIRRKQNKKSLSSKIIAKEEGENGRSKKTFRIRSGYLEAVDEGNLEVDLAEREF
ncbi:unnamed protein product [Hermetia illucens]|uniref:Uncharacterized protein n=1 Tax=Hermetia illucens TaxID=343691 RepID=A0A7R8UD98_HERIL|nr:unnamed protein product [Hermetia illucens]